MPHGSVPTPLGLVLGLGGALVAGLAVGALILVLVDRAPGLLARVAGQVAIASLWFGCLLAAVYASAATAPHTIVLGPP